MDVLIGSEALSSGRVTRHGLTSHYQRVFPDVYAPAGRALTLHDRTAAAWLWSQRRGIVTGAAASALHGARWVDAGVPVELNLANNKSPAGIVTRWETLLDNETQRRRGLPVTSVDRTAFDLARRGPVLRAVQRLDALARATGFRATDVLDLAGDHPRVRGLRRMPDILDLVDPGGHSPKETWLRLLLLAAGFPAPRTQTSVPGPDGYPRYYLDMAWEEFMVAVEYDGQQHRTDAVQYRNDVLRGEYIAHRGWRRIVVLAGHRCADIIGRVERAGVPRDASNQNLRRPLLGFLLREF